MYAIRSYYVGQPRELDRLVELVLQLLDVDGLLFRPDQAKRRLEPIGPAAVEAVVVHLAPLLFRLEHDGGLEHRQGGRVGRRLGASDLAEGPLDLGEAGDDRVGLSYNFV